jgi:hypothetical protein
MSYQTGARKKTLIEVEVFSYSGCGYTMTATAIVTIGGEPFPAELLTYTFFNPGQNLVVTFNYPGVTLSTLSVGKALTFVLQPYKTLLTSESQSHRDRCRRTATNRDTNPLHVHPSIYT